MPLRLFIFFIFIFLVFVYTGLKLGHLAHFKKRGKILLWTSVGIFFFISIGWQFFYRFHPELENSIILSYYWISAVTLGVLATFLTLAIPFDVFILFNKTAKGIYKLVLKYIFKKENNTPINYERRKFIAQSVTMGLIGVSGGITALGVREAVKGPQVKNQNFKIKNLHPDLAGFRIVQISDLHIGPNILRKEVENIVSKVNELKPDLIAVTGDLGDGRILNLRRHLEPLADLKSKYGIFYVTGNHEYYWDVNDWLEEAKRLKMKALIDENEIIKVNNARLLVGGVPDPSGSAIVKTHEHDPFKAIRTTQKIDFNLLLAHRPDSCYEAEAAGFNLQLSGHTHGGQFFPWNLYLPLVYKYYRGAYQHKNLALYVNSGTGYWGPPHRFAIPSEITLLTLS
ncbi:MAG: metallophosphoesterase [Bacteriovoracales bacterium]